MSSLWVRIREPLLQRRSTSHLIKEDILAITAFCCEILQVSILVDAVFLTELLPELAPDWESLVLQDSTDSQHQALDLDVHTAIAALACLHGNYLPICELAYFM